MNNRKRKSGSRFGGLGWIGLVLLLLLVAVRVLTQQEEVEPVKAETIVSAHQDNGTWTAMPDSVLVLCKPASLTSVPEQVLERTSYVVSYNAETRCPNLVAWQLTADHTDGLMKRISNFHEDEDCPLPRATLQDYRGSGWSRGHMCPAGDNKWSRQAMYDSFSLVNVCPQNAKLNSGVWNSVETDCRRWARQYGEVYIVCGPVWSHGPRRTIGANAVAVPDAFFKVVLRLSPTPQAFGIVVKNTEGTRKRDLYYNSVDQVERITGIDLFPALPDDVERQVEATADMAAW